MTELVQHRYPSFSHMISKLDTTTVTVNIDLVMKDIEKFEKAIKNSRMYNKANIKAIVIYLRKLVKSLNEDLELELAWNLDKSTELLKSYPIKLVCEDAYAVNTCNYIEIEPGNKLVDIDTTELANIIAFEFMCRDLGDTHETIEELLKNCGVTTVESSDILLDYIKDTVHKNSTLFELSKILRVEDSPYRIREDEKMQDYFGTRTFKGDRYRDVVSYSCEYANTVILSNIFKEASKHKLNLRVLSLDPTRIQFEIKEFPDEKIRDELVGDVVIRVFGRKFRVSNKINIY